jgi:hypothetical protein
MMWRQQFAAGVAIRSIMASGADGQSGGAAAHAETAPPWLQLRDLLLALQWDLVSSIVRHRQAAVEGSLHAVAAETAADTIYAIDRISESALLAWLDAQWPPAWPVELVMEGVADGEIVTFPRHTAVSDTRLKLIIDPIDGTRNLMFDKRSAWVLCGLAVQRGAANTLRDITVAAMTEIPTTKQSRIDQVAAVRGGGLLAQARAVGCTDIQPLRLRPSAASDLRHSFASFVKFFAEAQEPMLAIEQRFLALTIGPGPHRSPLVFNDQYISTGGQFYEVLSGRDRFIADLRPLVYAHAGCVEALVCHPYDACCALLLEEGGCVIEDPWGQPLAAPLDTTSPVAWVAYANPQLAAALRPQLQAALRSVLGPPASG